MLWLQVEEQCNLLMTLGLAFPFPLFYFIFILPVIIVLGGEGVFIARYIWSIKTLGILVNDTYYSLLYTIPDQSIPEPCPRQNCHSGDVVSAAAREAECLTSSVTPKMQTIVENRSQRAA